MSLIVYIFSVFFPCRRSSSALRVRSAGHALNLNKGCTKRQSLPNCQQNGRPGREYRPGKQDARCYFVRNGAATKVRRADAFLRKDRPTEPAAERHGKQLPQTRRPGFRGYKSRDPDRTAAERGAAAGDGVQATDNKRQALDDGRRNGRRTTGGEGMDGDGRRWTAGGRSKEWRKKNQTEYRRRRTDRQSWRAAGRESYRRRELRAGRATGGESYGPARRKRKTGRKTEQRAMQRRQTGLQSQAAKKQACATAGPTTRPEGRHTIFISARPEYASQRRESSYRPA